MEFEVVTAGDPALVTAWTRWSAGASPFASPGFFAAWSRAFGGEREPFLVVGRRGGVPALVLPLWRARDKPEHWYGLGEFRADYSEHAGEDPRALWAWLLESAPCRSVKLPRMPCASPLGRTAPPHDARRFAHVAHTMLRRRRARYHETREERDHPYADRAHIEALADRLASKDTRRKLGVLKREGEVSYECVRGVAVRDHLAAFFEMHARGFASTDRASQFERAAERRFYEALADECPHVIMDVLHAGARPVAMHLGFQDRETIYWYKPAFEASLAKGSPGRVLLAHIYARAKDEGITCVDLLKGGEDYKQDWANHVRPTITSVVVERSVREMLQGAAVRLRQRLTRGSISASLPLS